MASSYDADGDRWVRQALNAKAAGSLSWITFGYMMRMALSFVLVITYFSYRLRLGATSTAQADNDNCRHDHDPNSYGASPTYSARYLGYLRKVVVQEATSKVAKSAEEGRPQNTTGCIIDEEVSPEHLAEVQSSQAQSNMIFTFFPHRALSDLVFQCSRAV
jgi:hypothetical protein